MVIMIIYDGSQTLNSPSNLLVHNSKQNDSNTRMDKVSAGPDKAMKTEEQ